MTDHDFTEQNLPIQDVPGLYRPGIYRILVVGRLSEGWAGNFGDMAVSVDLSQSGQPITKLIGPVPDQAGLFGLLDYIRDLGLPLISVEYLPALDN
jgi:hypothetical protein